MLCYTVDFLDSVGLPSSRRFCISELAGTEVAHFLSWGKNEKNSKDFKNTHWFIVNVYHVYKRTPRRHVPQSFHSHHFNNKGPQMRCTCTGSPSFDSQLSRIKAELLKGKRGALLEWCGWLIKWTQTSSTCEMFRSRWVKHAQPRLTQTSWNQKVILRHFQIRGSLMSPGQWFIHLRLFERL